MSFEQRYTTVAFIYVVFCNETKETKEHVLGDFNIVKRFWLQLVDMLHSDCNYEPLKSTQSKAYIIDVSGNFFTVLMKKKTQKKIYN